MKPQDYQRLGVVSIEEVRARQKLVVQCSPKDQPRTELFGKQVKLFSRGTRLRTFYSRGTKCSACGLKASYYAVERPVHEHDDFPYHLNLWGLDKKGNEVLFTHDHTLARSAGGADNVSNTTTMCSPCNFAKSLVEKRGK
ncbi:hypothetical protein D3C76_212610 [compost metagenome]